MTNLNITAPLFIQCGEHQLDEMIERYKDEKDVIIICQGKEQKIWANGYIFYEKPSLEKQMIEMPCFQK